MYIMYITAVAVIYMIYIQGYKCHIQAPIMYNVIYMIYIQGYTCHIRAPKGYNFIHMICIQT